MIQSKSILVFKQDLIVIEKDHEAIGNRFLKYFLKGWQYRNRTIICKLLDYANKHKFKVIVLSFVNLCIDQLNQVPVQCSPIGITWASTEEN